MVTGSVMEMQTVPMAVMRMKTCATPLLSVSKTSSDVCQENVFLLISSVQELQSVQMAQMKMVVVRIIHHLYNQVHLKNAGFEPKCDLYSEFDCGEGKGCLPSERVCDRINDCGNWEDEPKTCFLNVAECEENNGGCDQLCVETSDSFFCACKPGFKLVDNSTCVGR